MDSWVRFLAKARPGRKAEAGLLLTLDPGETTGWAEFDLTNGSLLGDGQFSTKHPADMADLITSMNESALPFPLVTVVFERYKVYGTHASQHIGSEVMTIQHVGAIKVVTDQLDLRCVGQWAGQAKQFATDAKLRRWGLYRPNRPHANDAIRHGIYYLLWTQGRSD